LVERSRSIRRATHDVLRAERTELEGKVAKGYPLDADLDKPSTTVAQIRQFAKDELNTPQMRGNTREDVLDDLRRVHGQWFSGANDRLNALPSEIRKQIRHAFAVEHAKDPDLSEAERGAAQSFAAKGTKTFYPSLPKDIEAEAKKFR
jgi:hypothetical protein